MLKILIKDLKRSLYFFLQICNIVCSFLHYYNGAVTTLYFVQALSNHKTKSTLKYLIHVSNAYKFLNFFPTPPPTTSYKDSVYYILIIQILIHNAPFYHEYQLDTKSSILISEPKNRINENICHIK